MSEPLLQGDTALVTGAASGIGRGIVLALAKEGARAVLSDTNGEAGQKVADQLSKDGHDASFIAADLDRLYGLQY